ncbi:Uncharacterized protein FWK35_00035127 [Aphis craccivora]|uniref:Double jelly roll-like domain-containing protein n=1 Tax=Aphis craccivora TaxID=307492 RepID=A0A6G0VL27_APHCR|nr:Uncharacterized protein FWK35_00035127 [Aphis craccivora]
MDDFLGVKDAKFFIYGRYLQKDGKDYPKDSKIQLIDNFPAFLFTRMEVKKNGKVLDEIENPGVLSTIKGVLSYSMDPNGPIINSGFSSKYKSGGRFNVMTKFSQFGLGFFETQYPVFKGDMEINFTRNTDDDALLKKVVIGKEDGKIIIDELLIKIQIIKYEDINISGKTIKLDETNKYRSSNSSVFAGVVFQTNKLDTQEHDPCEFDHCNVNNFRFEINGRRYPEETQDLDFKTEKYCEAYDSLMEYKKTYNKTHQELPLMYNDPNDFKTFRAIYLVNISRQPTNITATKQNIILHVDFNEDLPKNTICYVFFVRNVEFLFDIEKGTIEESFTG